MDRLTICVGIILMIWGLTSCDEPTNGNDDLYVSTINISPAYLKIATGDTARLQVTVLLSDSSISEDTPAEWSVIDTSILGIDDSGRVWGLKAGETLVRASIEEIYDEAVAEVIDRRLVGKVTLENQTDHSAIMVSWLPLGEEQDFAGDGEGYVATDSLGYYDPPELEDGEWVFTAEYPYYALARDTVTMNNGKPQQLLRSLHLTQQLAFEVVLDKTEYSVEDTIWVKFRATNVTDDTLRVVSMTYAIYYIGYAITENGEPLLIEFNDGHVWGYTFQSAGVPAFDARTLLPGETKLEVSGEVLSYEQMYIDLNFLHSYGAIQPARSYEIYAGYVASRTYPAQYFYYPAEWSPYERIFNYSLYKKLTPTSITVRE